MKNKYNFILILIYIILLNSCGTGIKEALEGKRRSKSGDEFLIQKKNPLSLPPHFGDLPTPIEEANQTQENSSEELKKILNKNQSVEEEGEASTVENLILEEISKE